MRSRGAEMWRNKRWEYRQVASEMAWSDGVIERWGIDRRRRSSFSHFHFYTLSFLFEFDISCLVWCFASLQSILTAGKSLFRFSAWYLLVVLSVVSSRVNSWESICLRRFGSGNGDGKVLIIQIVIMVQKAEEYQKWNRSSALRTEHKIGKIAIIS